MNIRQQKGDHEFLVPLPWHHTSAQRIDGHSIDITITAANWR